MAKHKKNTVHIILMGRDEGTIEFFEKANGIGGKDCLVTVHDGRPNSAATSSEHRMELSVMSALKHTHSYMSPVVIMVDSVNEDPWFTRGVSARAKTLNIPLISLPKNAATAIPWMTKLDSGSLAGQYHTPFYEKTKSDKSIAWHKPTIDIVIQADKHSGSLIRLLKSLAKADYFNMNIPRLHIELEADVDVNVRRFISNYKWPGSNEPIIRHRILEKSSNSQQQAVDFVQSFFPATWDNFILILDPNAEVSPFFYHWFMYSILEYRYSSTSFHDTTTYAGVALHRPLDNLMGASFKKVEGPNSDHPFLYNAPSTQATVIFGEHWRQFHAYLSNRFLPKYADHVNYTLPVTLSNQAKQASWLSYFLELSTARGWLMLYPQFDSGQSLVILPQQRSIPSTDEELSLMTLQNTMLSQLPNGALPQWEMMHMFDVFGTKSDYSQLNAIRDDYLDQIASCRRTWKEPPGLSQVEDLFCRKDEWITASSTTTTEASVATPST